jgi:hypothetical protein
LRPSRLPAFFAQRFALFAALRWRRNQFQILDALNVGNTPAPCR